MIQINSEDNVAIIENTEEEDNAKKLIKEWEEKEPGRA